jgi:uncharacterized protein (DUF983 family)
LKQPDGSVVGEESQTYLLPREGAMLWAGLVAVALALVFYITSEPSLWAVLTSAAELIGVIGLFCLVCLSELLT